MVLNHSFIVIVARDWKGVLIFSLSRWVETNLPFQVKVEAINFECGFENVEVESDAKACIEALKVPTNSVSWRISTISTDTLFWASCGQQFVFRWSLRESNKTTHILASWYLRKNLSSCFVQGYAPSPFMDIINSEQPHVVFAV